jgi:hypothetical protein
MSLTNCRLGLQSQFRREKSGFAGRAKPVQEILTTGVLTASAATAATTTAAAAAVATTTTAASSRAAVIARTGFIDGQGAALNILAGESLDGGLSAFGRCHGDEGKAAGASAHTIGNQVDLGDWAVLLEQILQVIFSCVEGKVSHVQFCIHFLYWF